MIATMLLLLSILEGNAVPAPSPAWAYRSAPILAVTPPLATLATQLPQQAIAPSGVITYYTFLPLIARQPSGCPPIPGVQYATLSVLNPLAGSADEIPDFNLGVCGYVPTSAYCGLVDYGGDSDPDAPQLYTLFADMRVPVFANVYQVYNWESTCTSELRDDYPVTLAGMAVAPGEVLHLPDSGYDIGSGYEALVLYASEQRITLKYTREDHVVYGYTVHVENVCVEPSLLALYRQWDAAGRYRLPALRGGQPFGRAWGAEIGVAIRDTGMFMDPRSRKDWWQLK
jgi:hypothetical protein